MRKLLETKLCSRNLIKAINTTFLKWTRKELRPKDMKIDYYAQSLHPRDDIDKLYMPRKGERGLISIRECIDT